MTFADPARPTLDELTALPKCYGGWLDLRGTAITALPDNLTVGGLLDLSGGDVTYSVTSTIGFIKCGCESHPIAVWRALDDRGAIKMDGKRAAEWWRIWGPELLRWHDARFPVESAS